MIFGATCIVISCAGVMLERIAYRPLRRAPRLSAVVSALGASLVIQNGIMLIWGPRIRFFPADILPSTTWNIGGIYISFIQVVILFLSVIIMAGLIFLLIKPVSGRPYEPPQLIMMHHGSWASM